MINKINKFIKWRNNLLKYESGNNYILKKLRPIQKSYKGKRARILILADFHGDEKGAREAVDRLSNESFDFAVSLGDMSKNVLKIFNDFLKEKGHQLYAIRGNHDTYDLSNRDDNIVNFHKKTIDVNGIKIYGVEGCHKYNDFSTWTDDSEIFNETVEEDIDLLFSHTKAYTKRDEEMWDVKRGLIGLNKIICNSNIKHHLYGHFHDEYFKDWVHGIDSRCIYRARIIELRI